MSDLYNIHHRKFESSEIKAIVICLILVICGIIYLVQWVYKKIKASKHKQVQEERVQVG